MKPECSGHRALALATAGVLLLTVWSGTVTLAGDRTELEEATRLTWSPETRQEGLAALRRLVAADPVAVEPRLQLGRVLTWERETRPEGVAILRQLAQEQPGRNDITQSLAEVLTWDGSTRQEAVGMLQQLVADHPERISARLLLADTLSWNRPTREAAKEQYQEVLEDRPESVPAHIGLARILSWDGEMESAREHYQRALKLEPDNLEASVGLAEVDLWSGRSRAALRTLDAMPPENAGTPEAQRRRAEAYTEMGRPALALEAYESVLATTPGDDETRNRAAAVRRALDPTLVVGATGSTETGDPNNGRLEFAKVPLTYAWRPVGDTTVNLQATAGTFRNNLGSTTQLSLGAGVETPIGNRYRFVGWLEGHQFQEADSELTGRLELNINPVDRFKIRVGASRELLLDSRMAAVGEDRAGVFYGPVVLDEIYLAFSGQPARHWDYYVRGGVGNLTGDSIEDNDRKGVFAGFGRSFKVGRGQLRPGYTLAWMSYKLDLAGFPPQDLGGDGSSSRGVGGYFSPFDFLNQMIRLDAGFPLGQRVSMNAGAGFGMQKVDDVGADFADNQTSAEAHLGVRFRLNPSMALRAEINYMNAAAAFDRTQAGLYLVWTF